MPRLGCARGGAFAFTHQQSTQLYWLLGRWRSRRRCSRSCRRCSCCSRRWRRRCRCTTPVAALHWQVQPLADGGLRGHHLHQLAGKVRWGCGLVKRTRRMPSTRATSRSSRGKFQSPCSYEFTVCPSSVTSGHALGRKRAGAPFGFSARKSTPHAKSARRCRRGRSGCGAVLHLGAEWDRFWDRFGGEKGLFGRWNSVSSSGTSRIYKGFRLSCGFLR
jgi:hypothetical protein